MKKLALLILFMGGLIISCQNDQVKNLPLEKDISQTITIEKEEILENTVEGITSKKEEQPIAKTQRSLCTGKTGVLNSEKELIAQKADLSDFRPDLEQFVINPNKTEKIKTQNGTELIIPKGSFDTDLAVKISIRVYEDQKDAYTQQLTTITTDGSLLESAGMFHIAARTPKGEIDLATNAELILKTAESVRGDMDIYYGETDERGDVYWDLDENSKILAPIPVLIAGRFTYIARQYFIDNLRMSKTDLLALLNKEWTASITLDRSGNMIGWNNVEGDSIHNKASQYFIDFMKVHNFYKDPANWQLSPSFTFTAMSKGALDTLKAVEEYDEMMQNVWDDFEPSTADRRKSFAIGGLGYINIDREIQLPDFKQRTDVLVKKEGNADMKLMFTDKNSVVAASAYSEDYIIFRDVPLKSKVRLVGSCTKGTQMYYGVEEQTITKENNKVELAFQPCTKDEFLTKITNFLGEG